MKSVAIVVTAALAIVLMAACDSKPAARPGLRAVPEPPSFDQLDLPIREQYRERREALDALLSDSAAADSDLAQAFGEVGLWGMAYRMPDTAEPALANAERLAGVEGWPWSYYLGHLHRRLGSTDAAREAFRRVLEQRPADPPTLVWLGEIELAAGRGRQALPHFRAAVEHEPRCVRARVGLARIALLDGDHAGALEHLLAVLERYPDEPEVHYSLGLAYRGLGDMERAEEHLRTGAGDGRARRPVPMRDPLYAVLQGMNASADSLLRRARTALRSGRVREGVDLYRQAVATAPEKPTLRIGYGNALLRAERPDEALREYAEAIRLDPNNAPARYNMALVHDDSGDDVEAERLYRAALRADPRHARASLRLGAVLAGRGEHAEALGHFEAAVRGEPSAEEPRVRRVETLLELGRREDAVLVLESDLRALPQSAPLLELRSKLSGGR